MNGEIQQIKIFQERTIEKLEKEINTWMNKTITDKINANVLRIVPLEHDTYHIVLIHYCLDN